LLLKGEPCSGLTHQTYDYIDGKPIDPCDFSNFGGAKDRREPSVTIRHPSIFHRFPVNAARMHLYPRASLRLFSAFRHGYQAGAFHGAKDRREVEGAAGRQREATSGQG
jgi:hypothetical protein